MVCYTPSLSHVLLLVALAWLNAPSAFAHRSYIIVGGGPAGYVVAEQLSRACDVTVTLLEAGPDAQNDPMVNSMSSQTIILWAGSRVNVTKLLTE